MTYRSSAGFALVSLAVLAASCARKGTQLPDPAVPENHESPYVARECLATRCGQTRVSDIRALEAEQQRVQHQSVQKSGDCLATECSPAGTAHPWKLEVAYECLSTECGAPPPASSNAP